jgi:hypothetical protein
MILLPGMRFRYNLGTGTDDIFIAGIDLEDENLYVRRLGVIDGYVGATEQIPIDRYYLHNLSGFHQIRGLSYVPTR